MPPLADRSRKHASLIQGVITYLTTGLSIVQGLVLVPLYLEYIGSRMYGLWLGSGGLLIALSLLDLGLGRIITQRVAQAFGREKYNEAGQYFISGLSIYFIIGVLLVGIGFILSYPLPAWLGADISEIEILRKCFQIAVVVVFFKILNDCIRGFQTALLRPKVPMFGLLVFKIIGLTTNLVLLLKGYGLWAIPIGNFIIQFGSFGVNAINSKKLLNQLVDKITFDAKIFKELVEFSPSLIMGRIGSTGSKKIEPTLITLFLNPQMTTFFYVTRKAADLVSQLLHVLIGSVFSSYSHLIGEANKEKTIVTTKQIIYLTFFTGLIGIGMYICLNESFVNLWVKEKRFLGLSITVLIGLSIFIRVMQDLFSELLFGLDVIKKTNYLVFFEGILRVGLMSILIALIGVEGAPMGMIITTSIFSLLYLFMIYKKIEIDLKKWPIFKSGVYVLATIIGSYAIAYFLNPAVTWFIFLLYLVGATILYLMTAFTLEKFRKLFNSILIKI